MGSSFGKTSCAPQAPLLTCSLFALARSLEESAAAFRVLCTYCWTFFDLFLFFRPNVLSSASCRAEDGALREFLGWSPSGSAGRQRVEGAMARRPGIRRLGRSPWQRL